MTSIKVHACNMDKRHNRIEGGQESLLTACRSYATLPAMARRLRVAAGGVVYHVLNRGRRPKSHLR